MRGKGTPALRPFIIANSASIQVGDAIGLDSDGYAARVAAGTRLLGVVEGFIYSKTGEPVENNVDTAYTVESDNETVDMIAALVNVDPESLYSVGADDDLGTTTGSDTPGAMFDMPAAAYGQLDESTATHTYGTGGQLVSLGVDEANSARLIVRIHERLLS